MSAHPPPVPPANRSNKGTGEPKEAEPDRTEKTTRKPIERNQDSVRENTTNQGYQQDR
jgi:hypothetical protein